MTNYVTLRKINKMLKREGGNLRRCGQRKGMQVFRFNIPADCGVDPIVCLPQLSSLTLEQWLETYLTKRRQMRECEEAWNRM